MDRTADQTPPRPARRRRVGRYVALVALVSLIALAVVQGPVLVVLSGDEAAVIHTPEALGLLGPSRRVVKGATVAFALPLVQVVERVALGPVETKLDLPVTTRDGLSLALNGVVVRHRVRSADAANVAAAGLGEQAARDAAVATATRWAIAHTFATLDAPRLATAAARKEAGEAVARAVADAVAALGVEAERPVLPPITLPAGTETSLTELAALDRSAVEAPGPSDGEAHAAQRAAEDRRHATALREIEDGARARLAAAEAQLVEARTAAEADFIERTEAAKARRASLEARAAAVEHVARLEGEALAARVAALGENGVRVLDLTIATEIIPQLVRVRAGDPPPVPPMMVAPEALPVAPPAIATEPPGPAPEAPAAEAPK
ncbi:MAG: hypothetical protein KC620_25070 [Myxococcales bacterium]|nr:hypothetical protein [Myxococcales bacterium]